MQPANLFERLRRTGAEPAKAGVRGDRIDDGLPGPLLRQLRDPDLRSSPRLATKLMSSPHDISTTTLTERVVLLALIECETDDRTPATSNVIRGLCSEYGDALETEPLGQIREVDVMRSLNGLVGDGIVAEDKPDEKSPTGKGRPEYSLRGDVGTVLDELASDDRVTPLVDRVRD